MDMTGLGIGLEEETREEETGKVVSLEEVKKNKAPWFLWNVCGKELKLKLSASAVLKLEKKYKCNVLDLFSSGIPELSVMLTVIQAALEKYHHGVGIETVVNIYERWVEEEDGSQTDLMSHVVMPTLAVSGFFTQKQAQELLENLETESL
mgnify:CR=1 FL=1